MIKRTNGIAIGVMVAMFNIFSIALCKLELMHPPELRKEVGPKGSIESQLSNFGHIQYGTTIVGRVHYPTKNKRGCEEFDLEKDFGDDPLFDEDSDMTPIILVNSGYCSMVAKTRNIEKIGGKVALIADKVFDQDTQMSDDGTGHNLVTPALLIRDAESMVLKNAIAGGEHVVVKVSLEISHPDNDHIEYELWMGSLLDVDYTFLEDMYRY